MKHLITYVSLLVVCLLGNIKQAMATNFDSSRTYIIDASACDWVEADDCVIQFSEDDGSTWKDMTKLAYGTYSFKPTQNDRNKLKLSRHNAKGNYNSFELSCSDNADYEYITVNSSFNGVDQCTGRIAGEFIAASNWGDVTNMKVMTWDASKKAYKYEASDKGAFMVSTNSNFWNGRLKLADGVLSIPTSEPSSANLADNSGASSGDLSLPGAGTVYFRPYEKKIWYEPKTETVTYTYQLKFSDNSEETIEKDVVKTLTDLGGKSFQVVATPDTGSAITYGNNTTTSISENGNVALYEGQNAIALPDRTGNYTFKLNVGTDGKPTSIDVTVPEQQTTTEKKVYLRGNINNGDFESNNGREMKLVDGKWTLTLDLYAATGSTNCYFDFWEATTTGTSTTGKLFSCGWQAAPASLTETNHNTDITNYNTKASWYVTQAGNYTITLDEDCSDFTIIKNGGSDPDPEDPTIKTNFYLYTYEQGYANKQQLWFYKASEDSKIYELNVDKTGKDLYFFPGNEYNSFGFKGSPYFQQHGDQGSNDYKQLDKGAEKVELVAQTKIESVDGIHKDSQFPLFRTYAGTDLTFRIHVGDNNYQYYIEVVERETPPEPITLPTNKDRAGKYYLLGDVINDNYPSPAWEMKQEGDENTYIVQPFAMRQCKTVGVAVYDNDGVPTIVEPTTIEGMPDVEGLPTHDKDGGGYFQPGVLCTAEYDPVSNTLTFTRVNNDVTDYVPYVGILGEKFKQATKYPTRHTGTGMGDTKQGWQEAFIEYGNDGKPRFAFDGTTPYYNTVWPPRNNILMQSDLGEGITPLNISTAETTMRRDSEGVKTGSEWETHLRKDNNYYDGLDFGEDKDKQYYRFYVSDMWMLGAFKIWTGWGGHKANRGTAEWENHWYWGPNASGQSNVEIKTGETTDARKDGNYQTGPEGKDRKYYRTMEVFIPVDGDKLSRDNVKIYLTQTPGGAQIDSYADNTPVDEKYLGTGAYLPKLMAELPKYGDKITSYKIVRYQYDGITDISNLKQVDVDGKTYENKMDNPAEEAVVKMESKEFNSKTAFNDYFTSLGSISDGNGTDYVKDAGLVAGMYKYCMEVVISSLDGTTETATVWSPYIRIVDNAFTIHPTNGQLVKLNAEDSDKYNAHYLVYNEQNINNGMLISLDESKRVTIAKRLSTQFPNAGDQQAQVTREVATKIFQETGEWTNMVGFMTKEPDKLTSVEATARKVDGVTLYRNDGTKENPKWENVGTFNKIDNWYVIRDRDFDLAKREYKVVLTGEITYAAKEGQDEETETFDPSDKTTYTPTFPLPYFGTPRVEIVKDAEGTKYEYTGTHDHIDAQETHNLRASELKVFVPVKMPNLVEKIKETVYGDLSMSFNGNAAVSGSVPSAEENISEYEYGLQYRYQSPYDWVKESNTQTAASGLDPVDQCGWEALPHTWTIAASYKTGMKGLKHSLIEGKDPMSATASFTPTFTTPSASPVYYYQLEKDNEGDGYHTTVYIKTYSVANIEDKIGGDSNKLPYGDKESLIMTHVTLQSGQSLSEGEALVNKHMTIGCAKEDSELHPIATKVIDKAVVEAQNWKKVREDMSTFLKKLQVEYGHVHLFKIGENPATSQSGFVGFTAAAGSFPYLRYDHQSRTNAPKRAASVAGTHANWTKEYIAGDNVLEFSPLYATANVPDNIATDVEELVDDMLNVEVGTGYIDMLGNDGRIFAADGREVYVGAGRAEVGQGVYMVVLPGKTLKVMVK